MMENRAENRMRRYEDKPAYTLHDKMRHPILSRVPLAFLGTCFHWAVT